MESWCSSSILDNEIIIGVLLVIDDCIPSRTLSSPASLEVLTVEILLPRSIVLSLVYIPPNSNSDYINRLTDYLSCVMCDHELIILGDFNLPDINWSNLSCNKSTSSLFCDFVFDHELFQFVESATHSKGNILDLVLAKSDDLVQETLIHTNEPLPNMISDHHLISFIIPCTVPLFSRNKPVAFNFRKGDYVSMNDHLAEVDYNSYYVSNDIELLWSFLKSLILGSCELYVPKSHTYMRRFPKWFNGEIIHRIHKVRSFCKKHRMSPSVRNTLFLKNAESNLLQNISEAKLEFESRLIQDFAFKRNNNIHNYIRSFTKQASLPSVMYFDSQKESTSSGKAMHSSTHVFNCDADPLLHDPSDSHVSDLFVTASDVFRTLTQLDICKAMGIDGIPNIVLKLCSKSLCQPIQYLFNQCVINSCIPAEWKIHKIMPIHKAGDKSSVKNYH